jgi:hypothetical protein
MMPPTVGEIGFGRALRPRSRLPSGSQAGLDLLDELRDREGLEQERVSTCIERRHDVVVGTKRREEDEGDALELLGLLDDPEEIAAVHVGHQHVTDDEVRANLVDSHQGVPPVGEGVHLEVRRAQTVGDQLAHLGVVVNEDNSIVSAHPPSASGSLVPPQLFDR